MPPLAPRNKEERHETIQQTVRAHMSTSLNELHSNNAHTSDDSSQIHYAYLSEHTTTPKHIAELESLTTTTPARFLRTCSDSSGQVNNHTRSSPVRRNQKNRQQQQMTNPLLLLSPPISIARRSLTHPEFPSDSDDDEDLDQLHRNHTTLDNPYHHHQRSNGLSDSDIDSDTYHDDDDEDDHLTLPSPLSVSLKSKSMMIDSLSSSPTTSSFPATRQRSITSRSFTDVIDENLNEVANHPHNIPTQHQNTLDTAGYHDTCEYEGTMWYFAIGSMINPVSLSLRGLHPIESHPALCQGYALIFDGAMGMASIKPDPQGQFHGVLHRLCLSEMNLLDKIEGGYVRRTIDTILYDGRRQKGYAYMMDESCIDRSSDRGLPPERYLDIIIRGCRHFGVAQTHITWLKHLPCLPRKKKHEYLSFDVNGDHYDLISPSPSPTSPSSSSSVLPMITMSELSQYDGKSGRPLCFGVNSKVIEIVSIHPSASTDVACCAYEWISQYGGNDATLTIARFIYEPIYPAAYTRLSMTNEHCQWVEDMLLSKLREKVSYRVIGRLDVYDVHHNNHKKEFAPCVLLNKSTSKDVLMTLTKSISITDSMTTMTTTMTAVVNETTTTTTTMSTVQV